MSFNITVEGGKSVRLKTKGKYCDRDIVVTAEGGGGDMDALISGELTDIESNAGSVRDYAFYYSPLTSANLPKATYIGEHAFVYSEALEVVEAPLVEVIGDYAFQASSLNEAVFPLATDIGDFAFNGCSNLEEANLPLAEYIGNTAFANCTRLSKVNLPSVTSTGTAVFRSCTGLKNIYLPMLDGISRVFLNACSSLENADFGQASSVAASAFSGCVALKALVLRYNGVASLENTNAFTNCYKMNGTIHSSYNPNGEQGYVYVPRDYLTQYPTATNWSSLPLRYRALEDYTVDGTTIGALDIDKMNGTSG